MKRKRCPKCGVTKASEDFHKNRTAPDGMQAHCKACFKARRQGGSIQHGSGCACKACVAASNAAVGLKMCAKCGRTKPFSEFYADRKMSLGLRSYCRSCECARVVADVRRRNYGVTAQDFRDRLESQNGMCAACGDSLKVENHGTAIDHDHNCCPGNRTCGECIRGILCMSCNLALGMIKDDPNRALALAAYLMSFQDVLAEGGVAQCPSR